MDNVSKVLNKIQGSDSLFNKLLTEPNQSEKISDNSPYINRRYLSKEAIKEKNLYEYFFHHRIGIEKERR